MSEVTEAESKAIAHSQRVVRSIDSLAANEAFQAFMERFERQADDMAYKILHGDMTLEDREFLRVKRLGLLEVLKSPEEDRQTHIRILEGFGMSDPLD